MRCEPALRAVACRDVLARKSPPAARTRAANPQGFRRRAERMKIQASEKTRQQVCRLSRVGNTALGKLCKSLKTAGCETGNCRGRESVTRSSTSLINCSNPPVLSEYPIQQRAFAADYFGPLLQKLNELAKFVCYGCDQGRGGDLPRLPKSPNLPDSSCASALGSALASVPASSNFPNPPQSRGSAQASLIRGIHLHCTVRRFQMCGEFGGINRSRTSTMLGIRIRPPKGS